MANITFYKEQLRRLKSFALEQNVELATVDSVQGREMEATIILTTRTDLAVGFFPMVISRFICLWVDFLSAAGASKSWCYKHILTYRRSVLVS